MQRVRYLHMAALAGAILRVLRAVGLRQFRAWQARAAQARLRGWE